MREARIKAEGAGYYHIMSRAIEGRFIFGTPEKEFFRRLMRKLETFCGVRIVTYSILSSHWHILLDVPERQDIDDKKLLRRIRALYGKNTAKTVATELKAFQGKGDLAAAERLKSSYTYRMYDLSEFCKCLKQRFSQYYNKKRDRCGPLWTQRFKSILVENSADALLTMAAYIDLNAVRAGLAQDPKNYRWCGYGEALGGSQRARAGLNHVMQTIGLGGSWSQKRKEYRQHLYVQGGEKGLEEDGRPLRTGFSPEQVEKALNEGGKLDRHDLLRCRVRYFSDGLVLGSQAFVEGTFLRYRDRFGLKRETGARPMKYGRWNGLSTMRDLRKAVIIVPAAG